MDPKVKARMLKILALAQEGVGGEQQNAERQLNRRWGSLTCPTLDFPPLYVQRQG